MTRDLVFITQHISGELDQSEQVAAADYSSILEIFEISAEKQSRALPASKTFKQTNTMP